MALLEVKGITKVFGGLVAVEKVEFKVNEGEIVSIIGPNGAGKTTIFNMLTGVYKVNDGTIEFEGKEIQNRQPRDIVKAGIARTFQNIRLFPTMRVIENVLVGEHIHVNYNFLDLLFKTKKYREEEKKAAENAIALLESLELGDQIDNYAKNLPYGMQRQAGDRPGDRDRCQADHSGRAGGGDEPPGVGGIKRVYPEIAGTGTDDPSYRT